MIFLAELAFKSDRLLELILMDLLNGLDRQGQIGLLDQKGVVYRREVGLEHFLMMYFQVGGNLRLFMMVLLMI